jgi:hypothetical protein
MSVDKPGRSPVAPQAVCCFPGCLLHEPSAACCMALTASLRALRCLSAQPAPCLLPASIIGLALCLRVHCRSARVGEDVCVDTG